MGVAFDPTSTGGQVDKGSEGFKTAAATAVPGHAGFNYLIVGAGFAGSVLAERLANAAG